MRCSKVYRRTTLQELQHSEGLDDSFSSSNNRETSSVCSSVPPFKKVRISKGSIRSETSNEDWNLANFKLLTDCVSSLTGDETTVGIINATVSNKTNSPFEQSMNYRESISEPHVENYIPTKESASKSEQQNQSPYRSNNSDMNSSNNEEDEYICVIRTSEDCFIPHKTPHSNFFMFSSILSTASVVAHDLGLRTNPSSMQEHTTRRGSPNGSSGSNNSSGGQPNSDSSKETKNSTSSETGSEDNSAETDSN